MSVLWPSVGALLLAALVLGTVGYLTDRRARWAREDVEAARFVAELQASAPLPPMAFYSTIREPAAMRALATEIAEQADRLEARHAYRGGVA